MNQDLNLLKSFIVAGYTLEEDKRLLAEKLKKYVNELDPNRIDKLQKAIDDERAVLTLVEALLP